MRRAAPALHLAPMLLLGLAWLAAATASAQSLGLVVRDGTLGSGPLEVGPGIDPLGQPATYLITPEMGEQRDGNLFHSFERFGIGTHETATFTGPDPIEGPQSVSNVISRVTGGNESRIEGTLRSTIPGADVWLLNPSGVVFGQGAQLDVEGSFHASTSDSLDFGTDRLEHFYSDLSRTSVLSTVTPMAFGFLSESGAALLAVERSALEVPDGETLELVGGDVSLALNAALVAPGGEVRLEAQGEVRVSQSLVDVGRTGDTPGAISIRGGNIVVEKSSLVRAENESSVPPPTEEAAEPGPGSIAIAASESVLVDASLLSVSTHGAGNAGKIDIKSPEVTLRNGLGFDPLAPPQENRAGARAETTSSGRGGEIRLHDAELVTLSNGIGVSASAVGPGVSGKAGDVVIAAQEVNVARDSYVFAETTGEGDGGSISIAAGESVLVDDSLLSVNTWSTGKAGTIQIAGLGDSRRPDVTFQHGPGLPDFPNESPHAIAVGAGAETHSTGAGGTIEIDASALTLADGVAVRADALGPDASGNAGTIDITADSVDVLRDSFLGAAAWRSPGDAGTIRIATDTLRLDGAGGFAFIDASVYPPAGSGTGTPGSIEITGVGGPRARSVELVNGGEIASVCGGCTSKAGSHGMIAIAADSLVLEGRNSFGGSSQLTAGTSGAGDAGMISIDAGSLEVSGGWINAQTSGAGNAGTISIDADSLEIHSGGFIDAGTSGAGNGGTITLGSDLRPIKSLVVDSGGSIYTRTEGSGNAGTIELDADSVLLRSDRSDIPSTIDAGPRGVAATGSGGTIDITTGTLVIEHGGFINAGSSRNARGNGGDIHIAASESIDITNAGGERFSLRKDVLPRLPNDGLPPQLFPTGIFSATVGGGDGGQITLDAPQIRIAEGAIVATSTVAGGDAGDILIGSKIRGNRILIEKGGVVDSTSFLTDGAAGSITLEADGSIEVIGRHPEFLDDLSRVGSASLGDGAPGAVTLRAPRILVDEGAVATEAVPLESGGAGTAGGAITLEARELVVRRGGQINASGFGQGAAGSITVDATGGSILVQGAGSGIVSRTGASGDGGGVELHASRIEVASGGEISARSAPGLGEVEAILASLRDDGLLRKPPDEATGDAGVIRLFDAETIHLIGGRITTSASDSGGGNIDLQATKLVHLDAGVITASVTTGQGGNITIDPEVVLLENGSRIEARAGAGTGGNIQITADNFFAFPGSVVSVEADSEIGIDGTVEIHSPDVNLAGALTELPSSFLDATALMRERCAARRGGERAGSFAVRGPGGIPAEPDGWLPAPLLPDAESATAAPAPSAPVAGIAGPLLAPGACL